MGSDILESKVVLITGASEGIGRATSLELARYGVRLVLVARNTRRLESAAKEVHELGGKALAFAADVTNKQECFAAIKKATETWGRLDGVINNAGMTMWANFEDIQNAEVFERLINVNYLSSVYFTMAALPHLRQTRGRILAVSSVAGTIGVPAHTGYSASKFALQGFFEALRIELRGSGVSVSIVTPDFVVSQIHKRGLSADGSALNAELKAGAMTAEKCAQIVVQAFINRRRQVSTSLRGKFAPLVRVLMPGFLDRVQAMVVRKNDVFR